jgi:ABC-type amino acid transport substrate-binding protein
MTKLSENIPFINRGGIVDMRRLLNSYVYLLLWILVLQVCIPVSALAEPLLMLFREKPPYSYVENGVQKGFLLEKTQKILARAKIESKFTIVPPKRLFQEIQDNAFPVCSFGWYKNPEREKYARFSLPIHQDRPQVVLASPKSAKLHRHKTLKSVMADPTLVIAVLDAVSYGPELDAMIAAFPGKIDKALLSVAQVVKKVAAHRADLMFIDQDDYDYLAEINGDVKNAGLVRVVYPDLPAGLKRYILCSHKVSEEVMRKINTGISTEKAH